MSDKPCPRAPHSFAVTDVWKETRQGSWFHCPECHKILLADEPMMEAARQTGTISFAARLQKPEYTEEQLRRIALYGSPNDLWRVDATFSHLDKPVTYMTNEGKKDAYREVTNFLMSKNIQCILVYRNDTLQQTIHVE